MLEPRLPEIWIIGSTPVGGVKIMPHTTEHGAEIDPIRVEDNPYEYPNDLDWVKYSNVRSRSTCDNETALNWAEGSPVNRVIIAGSRTIQNIETVERAMLRVPAEWFSWTASELVHGGASGVDSLAEEIAKRDESNIDIITEFDPRFDKFLAQAGPERNREMAQYADYLLAIWDGQSSGTRSMIDHALEQGLEIHVVNVGHQNL